MREKDQFQLAKYTIIEKVGQGGMAEVYKGVEKNNNKVVAVKFMRAALRQDDLNVLRFKREAETLALLKHPHIVEVYEFSQTEDKTYYLVLEFINGPTLHTTLKELAQAKQLMPLEQVRQLMNQLGSALKYTHDLGIIHRDIKPDNIMLRADDQIVLTDFGLAKLVQTQNSLQMTVTGAIIGTPAYMSPEQALGSEGDARADIYSLGVVLFQLVTGQLPFEGSSVTAMLLKIVNEPPPQPSEINPTVPADLEEIILKSLAKEPSERFQSIDELLATVGVSNFDQTVVDMQALMDTQLLRTAIDQEILLEALMSNPFQVPPLPANFVGRYDEIEQLKQLLNDESQSLIGLVGFGGAGKSAVASMLAHDLRASYPDGVLWAYLDATDSLEYVLHSFASAFKQTAEIGRLPDLPGKANYVRDLLADKQVLVILDHVTDAEQVRWLRPLGSKNQTIITTRDGGLLRELEAAVVPIPAFDERESIAYFERVLGEHRVSEQLEYAQEIARLVDGIPLALSIIAGSLAGGTDFSMQDCVELLQDEEELMELLTNIEASFELSYKILTKREKTVFKALGTFDGPDFDSNAVAAVTGIIPGAVRRVLNKLYLTSVLSAGLGKRDGYFPIDTSGNGRYRLNLMLKAYARQKLNEDELYKLQEKATHHYAQFAEDHRLPDKFLDLDLEWDNIRLAAKWAQQNGLTTLAHKIAQAVTHIHLGIVGYADLRGHYQEARDLLRWSLNDLGESGPTALKIDYLIKMGALAYRQTQLDVALDYFRESEGLLDIADAQTVAEKLPILCHFAALTVMRQDTAKAREWVERGLREVDPNITPLAQGVLQVTQSTVLANQGQFTDAIAAAKGALVALPEAPSSIRITALRNLNALSAIMGNVAQADEYFEAAEKMALEHQDLRELVIVKTNQGIALQRRSNYRKALKLLEDLGQIQNFLGSPWVKGGSQNTLGTIKTKLGLDEEAKHHFDEALRIATEYELVDSEAAARINLAALLIARNEIEEADKNLRQAEELSKAVDFEQFQAELLRLQAIVQLQRNKIADAQNLIDQSLRSAKEQSNQLEEGQSWRVQATIYFQQGAPDKAQTAYDESLTLLKQMPYEYAKTQLAISKSNGLREMAEQAAETFRRLGARRELQQAETLLRN